MAATVGAILICGDEVPHLKRILPQLEGFDQVVIGWNGKDPATRAYLKKLKAPYEYFRFEWRPTPESYAPNEWGFSYARNLTLDRIKTDYVLWVDSDDLIAAEVNGKTVTLNPAQVSASFRNLAEKRPDLDHWMIDYNYSYDDAGNLNVVYARERFLKVSSGWRCVYPIHEVFIPAKPPKYTEVTDIKIVHVPIMKSESGVERNLRMLDLWYKQLKAIDEDHSDLSRAILLIGDTMWSQGRYAETAKWIYQEFLQAYPSAHDLERWQCWSLIAKCHIHNGNLDAGRHAALQCIGIKPNLPDGYYQLAEIKAMKGGEPADVLSLVKKGDDCNLPPRVVVRFPLDYTFTPYFIKAQAYFEMGEHEKALEWANAAMALCPTDSRIGLFRSKVTEAVRTDGAVEAAKALYQLLQDFDENLKASHLYDTLPYVAQQRDEIISLAEKASERVRHMQSDEEYVKLYAGNTHWTPVPDEFIKAGQSPGFDRYNYILGRLKKSLPNGGRILDVGCSDGFHSLMFAAEGYEVVGVDLDKRCVDLANKRAEDWGRSAKFVHAFFEKVDLTRVADPFDKTRAWFHNFDAVICAEVIEHVQDPASLLGALGDCAKDGAPIIITTPDGAFDKGDIPVDGGMFEEEANLAGHVRVYTQATFEAILRSNISNYRVVESHFLPYRGAYREHQGWQVGEIRRESPLSGPIVRIYCGSAVETFSPLNLTTGGIGGSETAVIHMANEWLGLGCRVVVYNNEQGVYDGVLYRNCSDFNPEHGSDILIGWRNLVPFRDARPNAKTTVAWVHDIYFPQSIDPEVAERIDKVAVLTNWHRDLVEEKHPEFKGKTWVTRNGIDPVRYAAEAVKTPYHYFYSSSPDRGLEQLLDIWPQVTAQLPEAILHVAYGFDVAIKVTELIGTPDRVNHLRNLKSRVQSTPGVEYHDRMNQEELARLQQTCRAWLYPHQGEESFPETYCITAVEAQAAKAWPITRLNAALSETVQNRTEWTENMSVDLLVAYLRALEGVVTQRRFETYAIPDNIDRELEENHKWAMSQTWESLAQEWLDTLIVKEESEEKILQEA